MGTGCRAPARPLSRSLKGPGLFFIIPVIETVAYWIDTRVITSAFKAEKTLTKDTVPVDVDAVLFWKVVDPKKAALDVADYVSAINWASQTALRDVIGKTMLSDMLEGRDKISGELQKIIDIRTEPWGIDVIAVEVKDVLIPPALEDAMSMQAQAERERQARVILGDSERQVAEKFGEAAKTYANNPTAFHLRAMNMLYEGLKKNNATLVIVPSTAVETMQLGGLAGVAALTGELPRTANQVARPGLGPNRRREKCSRVLASSRGIVRQEVAWAKVRHAPLSDEHFETRSSGQARCKHLVWIVQAIRKPFVLPLSGQGLGEFSSGYCVGWSLRWRMFGEAVNFIQRDGARIGEAGSPNHCEDRAHIAVRPARKAVARIAIVKGNRISRFADQAHQTRSRR